VVPISVRHRQLLRFTWGVAWLLSGVMLPWIKEVMWWLEQLLWIKVRWLSTRRLATCSHVLTIDVQMVRKYLLTTVPDRRFLSLPQRKTSLRISYKKRRPCRVRFSRWKLRSIKPRNRQDSS
jgi:hypothetical protein